MGDPCPRLPGETDDELAIRWQAKLQDYGRTALRPAAVGTAAHSAKTGSAAPAPLVTTTVLSPTQWEQLITRVGALPSPKVATKPSSAALYGFANFSL